MSANKKSSQTLKMGYTTRLFVHQKEQVIKKYLYAIMIHSFWKVRWFCKWSSAFTPFTAYKTTIILIDGKRVKLQLWDTSGQGRFCTIIRSYSRGAQGILLVYDITNKWSFEGISRWLHEVDHVREIKVPQYLQLGSPFYAGLTFGHFHEKL